MTKEINFPVMEVSKEQCERINREIELGNYIADELDDDIEDDLEQIRQEAIDAYIADQLADDIEEEVQELRRNAFEAKQKELEAL